MLHTRPCKQLFICFNWKFLFSFCFALLCVPFLLYFPFHSIYFPFCLLPNISCVCGMNTSSNIFCSLFTSIWINGLVAKRTNERTTIIYNCNLYYTQNTIVMKITTYNFFQIMNLGLNYWPKARGYTTEKKGSFIFDFQFPIFFTVIFLLQ